MAAGQTLVMLTGGIDLSVASVATGSAYLMASHSGLGGAWAVTYRSRVGLAVGLINGVGIALLSVQPLVMTLGNRTDDRGHDDRLQPENDGECAASCRSSSTISAPARFLGVVPIDLLLWVADRRS